MSVLSSQSIGKGRTCSRSSIVFRCIRTDAQDFDIRFGKGIVVVSEITTFCGAARRVGLREEPDQQLLAFVVFEALGRAVGCGKFKCGRFLAYFEHRSLLVRVRAECAC